MLEYLIRFSQIHESFRKPELEALASFHGIDLEVLKYEENSPFCTVRLVSEKAAYTLISRSILAHAIYELWGVGTDYPSLHADVHARTASKSASYKDSSFRFTIDSYQGKRNSTAQRSLIESFKYFGFKGPITMNGAELQLCIFEDYEQKAEEPFMIYLGRLITGSQRQFMDKYNLKKRRYISTTSFDSELALVTANITHAAAGKLFYDPFMGTGSFPIACAHFGAMTVGSDIDSRSIRGKKNRNVLSNFHQYGLTSHLLDNFISDLTHTPLRVSRCLDGIICDPPYGVREGLKVLGKRGGGGEEVVMIGDKPAHLQEGYLAPKKPYSFNAMLDDILEFSAKMLVDNGRLSMWMPTAAEDIELGIPSHPWLQLVSVCVQPFNKWARRLLTYRRLPEAEIDQSIIIQRREYERDGTADELNAFRKKYFEGFKEI